jgi:hypothetical protein
VVVVVVGVVVVVVGVVVVVVGADRKKVENILNLFKKIKLTGRCCSRSSRGRGWSFGKTKFDKF